MLLGLALLAGLLGLLRWSWVQRTWRRIRLGLFLYVGIILSLAALRLAARAFGWDT